MEDAVHFLSAGSANVHTDYLDMQQISELCSTVDDSSVDYIIRMFTQIQYGMPQERVIVARTSAQSSTILAGKRFIGAVCGFLKTNIYYDAWNGRLLEKASGKYCLPARMLISAIKSTKLRDAVNKLCPDKSDEIRDAIFQNLYSFNQTLSSFKHPVCFIDCDEQLLPRFVDLFQ